MNNMNETVTKSCDQYAKLAEAAWDQSWMIFTEVDAWKTEAGKDLNTGLVTTQCFNDKDKVFRIQSYVDATPEMLFDIFVTNVVDWPKWNPTMLDCKHIAAVNNNTDIAYNLAAPGIGGLVSSRDFLNLRHWKSRDGIMLVSACGTTHEDMPLIKNLIRGENRPACFVFERVKGEPGRCLFTFILAIDLKGWIPQYVVNLTLSRFLMDYLSALNLYAAKLKKEKKTTTT